MMLFTFTIPGPPVGKGRPRLGRGGHVYTPPRTVAYENVVRLTALAARGARQPIRDGPVGGWVTCTAPMPQRASSKLRLACGDKAYVGKPDLDNVAKIILDALSHDVLYHDDSQVSFLELSRRRGAVAGVIVEVHALEGES